MSPWLYVQLLRPHDPYLYRRATTITALRIYYSNYHISMIYIYSYYVTMIYLQQLLHLHDDQTLQSLRHYDL